MQDLEKFKNDVNVTGKNVYVGQRYVPKIMGEWDNTKLYEPLSIVQYQGASYTSRQYVPVGVELTNEEYWAVTGNYNAQVEQYRQDVNNVKGEVINARNGENTLNDRLNKSEKEINVRFEQNVINMELFKKRPEDIDDSKRIQRAMDYAHSVNKPLVFNGGVYYVKMLNIPTGLTLIGNGAILKKPNLSAPPYNMTTEQMKWQRLAEVKDYSGDVDSAMTRISGFTFDGSCWDMWKTPSYEQEQASLILVSADHTKKGRVKIKFDDCHFVDNVSDGIHLWKNVDAQIDNCSSYDCFRGGLVITGGYSKVNVNNFSSSSNLLSDGIDVEVDTMGYGGTYAVELNFNNIIIDNDLDVDVPEDSICNMSNVILSKEKGSYALGVGFNSVLNVTNSQFALRGANDSFNRLLLNGVAKFKNCHFYIKERKTTTTTNSDSALYIFSFPTTSDKGIVGQDWTVILDDCHFSYLGADYMSVPNVGIRTSNGPSTTVITNNCTFDNTLSGGIVSHIQYLHTRNNRYNCRDTGIYYMSNQFNVGNHVVIDNPILLNDEVTYLNIDGVGANIKHLNTVFTDKTSKIKGNNVVNAAEHDLYNQTFIGNRLIYTDINPNTSPYVFGIAGDIAISTTPVLGGRTEVWKCTRSKSPASPYNSVWVEITDPNLVVGIL